MSDDTDDSTVTNARLFVDNERWPLVVKLNRPFEFGKETIAELAFNKGTFGVLKGLRIERVPNVDECQVIASRLCGKALKIIEMLDPDDTSEVIGIALGFFNRCQGAGKKNSAR
jgi:hypothetical protein